MFEVVAEISSFFSHYGLAPEPKCCLETFLALTSDCLTLLCSINLPLLCACQITPSCTPQTPSYISAGSSGDVETSMRSNRGKEGSTLTDCKTVGSSMEQWFSPLHEKVNYWELIKRQKKLLHFRLVYPTVRDRLIHGDAITIFIAAFI